MAKVSECCGSSIKGETVGEGKDEQGVCSTCYEWSSVWDDEDDESKEN